MSDEADLDEDENPAEELTVQCRSCNLFSDADCVQKCLSPECDHQVCDRCPIACDYCMDCEDYVESEVQDSEDESRVGEEQERVLGNADREEDQLDDRDTPAHVALKWGEWFADQHRTAGTSDQDVKFEELAALLVDELERGELPKAPQRTNIRVADADLCLAQGEPRFLLLGAYTTRGAGITAATSTPRGRRLLHLVHQLSRAGGRPQEEYVSVSISSHRGLATHTDRNNHPDELSWHVGLGSYKGGLLRLSKEAAGPAGRAGLHQVRNKWTGFHGTGEHSVTAVNNEERRYGITLFTPNHLERLQAYDWEILQSYQFPCRRLRAQAKRLREAAAEGPDRRGGEVPHDSGLSSTVLAAADQYLAWVTEHLEGTAEDWIGAIKRGTSLLTEGHHSVASAVKAVWACRTRRGLDNLRNAEETEGLECKLELSWAQYLKFIATQGMPARSEAPRNQRCRQQAQPHPSAVAELSQVYKALWKDVRKGRILLVPTEQLRDTSVQSSPLAAVPKMLPDRTMAAECRVVHDQRITNQHCPSTLHPPALQPKHNQIARLVKWWKAMLPGVCTSQNVTSLVPSGSYGLILLIAKRLRLIFLGGQLRALPTTARCHSERRMRTHDSLRTMPL
eukprot:1122779-Amphidinium_carterae.1